MLSSFVGNLPKRGWGNFMFKHLFVLLLITMALQIEARVDRDLQTRIEWVQELKSFMQDVEQKNPEMLTNEIVREYVFRFSLFSEAIASGSYDCFFAGWPSKLVKSGGKRLCLSPIKGNFEYQSGSCKQGQMQCQPLMFGKGLCVGFSSSKDKQLAFSSCEKKFKVKGNYDFLKSLTQEEKTALKEISVLAKDICETGSIGIQKSKPMCQRLLSKFKDGLSAIERAPASDKSPSPVTEKEEAKNVEAPAHESEHVLNSDPIDVATEGQAKEVKVESTVQVVAPEEICEPAVVVDKKIEGEAKSVMEIVNTDTDKLYNDIKEEFLKSPLCAPEKVFNNPKDRLSPILFTQLLDDMRFVVDSSPHMTREVKIKQFKELATNYQLSEETIKYGEEMLANYKDTSEGRFEAMARLRGVMLQDMAKVSASTEGYQADAIKEGLASQGVFSYDDEGNSVCPFVDKEAFNTALAGRDSVLQSSHKGSLSNPDVLTIVDYSKPSNQRRMYVIDLKTKKVLHNTWVAHGGGQDRSASQGKMDPETGKYNGSSPATSNQNKSLLSSEGFYIATKADHGNTYLDNVLLKGIDSDNSNMGSRAIVVHGWRTPAHAYTDKTWEMSDASHPVRIEGKDIYQEFMKLDFKTTKEDLFNVTQDVRSAASLRPYMDATDGCLGVPDTKMGQADRKGRNKSQLELLREDLPGTLMFNYNGKSTKSKYIK